MQPPDAEFCPCCQDGYLLASPASPRSPARTLRLLHAARDVVSSLPRRHVHDLVLRRRSTVPMLIWLMWKMLIVVRVHQRTSFFATCVAFARRAQLDVLVRDRVRVPVSAFSLARAAGLVERVDMDSIYNII